MIFIDPKTRKIFSVIDLQSCRYTMKHWTVYEMKEKHITIILANKSQLVHEKISENLL